METFTLSLGRCWLIRAVGRNPLVRTSDRVEALTLILVFATVLVFIPVAGAIGTGVHDTNARAYAEQSRDRRPFTAVVSDKPSARLVEDGIGTSERAQVVVTAPVRWRIDGADHTDTLKVDPDTKIGDRVDIWVDDGGDRVTAPTPMSQAGIDGLVAAAASWSGLIACAGGLLALARVGLTRRRGMGWDRDLRTLVGHGGGRTGSQT